MNGDKEIFHDEIIANSCEQLFDQARDEGLTELYPPTSRAELLDRLNKQAADIFDEICRMPDGDEKEKRADALEVVQQQLRGLGQMVDSRDNGESEAVIDIADVPDAEK